MLARYARGVKAPDGPVQGARFDGFTEQRFAVMLTVLLSFYWDTCGANAEFLYEFA